MLAINRKAGVIIGVIVSLIFTWSIAAPGAKFLYDSSSIALQNSQPSQTQSHTPPIDSQTNSPKKSYGKITDKVATITDTQWTPRLIPIILHYHSVLGPDWPIVFYTSQELIDTKVGPNANGVSGSWKRALEDGRVEIRLIPTEFNMTSRYDVNVYLARPWLWENLAPATHVLVFQADAILCANSPYRVEDFFEYDFVGALYMPHSHLLNGGLSLRNRTMLLDILKNGESWEEFHARGKAKEHGEDTWFTKIMEKRKDAHLPEEEAANRFALQYSWHINKDTRPLGYHKVQKNSPKSIPKIAEWCPEIMLTQAGSLGPIKFD